MTTSVSDKLLATLDSVMDGGDTLPIEELRNRLAVSKHFEHCEWKIYNTVIELPLTVDMVLGKSGDAVNKIVTGLREIHGDQLMFKLVGHIGEVSLHVRMWRDDASLRSAWKECAEDEYKSQVLKGAA